MIHPVPKSSWQITVTLQKVRKEWQGANQKKQEETEEKGIKKEEDKEKEVESLDSMDSDPSQEEDNSKGTTEEIHLLVHKTDQEANLNKEETPSDIGPQHLEEEEDKTSEEGDEPVEAPKEDEEEAEDSEEHSEEEAEEDTIEDKRKNVNAVWANIGARIVGITL